MMKHSQQSYQCPVYIQLVNPVSFKFHLSFTAIKIKILLLIIPCKIFTEISQRSRHDVCEILNLGEIVACVAGGISCASAFVLVAKP